MRFDLRRVFAPAAIVCGALLAGCGGQSGGNSATEQTVQFGRVTTRLVGTAQTPVVASGLGSVVTGVAGANITLLTMSFPANNLNDTRFGYFAVNNQLPGLYLTPFGGGERFRVWPSWYGASRFGWSTDGSQIISDGLSRGELLPFTDFSDSRSVSPGLTTNFFVANPSNINILQADGSVRPITSSGRDCNPSWGPTGRICFESWRDGNGELYLCNPDGTGLVNFTRNAAADCSPTWSPDGNWIAWTSNRSGTFSIHRSQINDGTSNTVFISEGTASAWDPQYSPDGRWISYVTNKSGNADLWMRDAGGLLPPIQLTNSPQPDYDAAWSPDSSSIAYTRINISGVPEVWTLNINSPSTTQRLREAGAGRPFWSPFIPQRTLIGPGRFLQNVSGFLFGQKEDAITSFVAFATTTPSTARVAALSPQDTSAPNFVFDVTSSDSLRLLVFLNDFYRPATFAVVPPPAQDLPPPQPTGALVTFNAQTGRVSSVLPYKADRSAGDSSVSRTGAVLTVRRNFTGIIDATGKNLAPNGATKVQIDTATGMATAIQ